MQTRNVIKIGRPGYKVTKARDLTSNQRSLLFEVDYPEAEDGAQPRHRFMSAYEQKIEAPDKGYQVLYMHTYMPSMRVSQPRKRVLYVVEGERQGRGAGEDRAQLIWYGIYSLVPCRFAE